MRIKKTFSAVDQFTQKPLQRKPIKNKEDGSVATDSE